MTNVRAVAVGIPDRLKDTLTALDGVLVLDMVTALGVLEDHPNVHIVYGQELFGAAVVGQPVFLSPRQRDGAQPSVWVLLDHHPEKLTELEWDDPRQLAVQASIRLNAGRLVDISYEGALEAFDTRLNEPVDTPTSGGHTEDNTGND